jgi:hypothetical protein
MKQARPDALGDDEVRLRLTTLRGIDSGEPGHRVAVISLVCRWAALAFDPPSRRRLTEVSGGQTVAANVDTLRRMPRAASSSSRLTAKGRAARARIIDAAARLMYENGAANTSFEDVRKAAKASGSQMSHYFADKRSLIRAVIAHQAAPRRIRGRSRGSAARTEALKSQTAPE